ncbi:hypothetical protein BpHYR1_048435 [Brachionus plicatilis]|uniref:Uncharacterized protein n=1 Tax=Brachionus plicatilis TaxID=10195 RepID=A0A3M7SSI6_BRAPC|nr:hypothetical protein BpHYR1_048435 [Brachionus plicatilis]
MVNKIIKYTSLTDNKITHFSGVQAHALRTPFQKCLEGRIFFQHQAFSYKQVPRFLQLQRQYHRYDNNLCAAQMMSKNKKKKSDFLTLLYASSVARNEKFDKYFTCFNKMR